MHVFLHGRINARRTASNSQQRFTHKAGAAQKGTRNSCVCYKIIYKGKQKVIPKSRFAKRRRAVAMNGQMPLG